MRPLLFSINVTLDGCCDHRVIPADEELHRRAAARVGDADGFLFGRVTYELMEAGFRAPGPAGQADPFAVAINAAQTYVVSSTLEHVDWNAELVRGDLREAVTRLKEVPGKGLLVGGVRLARTLAQWDVIDEYEFVVHPRIVGHGPTVFAGLSQWVDLDLVDREHLASGAVALRYRRRT